MLLMLMTVYANKGNAILLLQKKMTFTVIEQCLLMERKEIMETGLFPKCQQILQVRENSKQNHTTVKYYYL